jgi:LysR family transcriptional regulator, regulator for metE and metH
VARIAIPKPKLDVRDLELVLAVAAAGSTVKAASALHITQSAVSRGLLLAEEKLGARLFDRTPRGLAPTLAGERLIEGASSVLGQLVEIEKHAEAPIPEPARLRLVCECYTAYRWLPSTLASLRRNISSFEVTLAIEHSAAPVPALLEGNVDIALLTTSDTREPLLELPLFSDEIVFVVARSHALAARPSLTPGDLTEHPLLTSSQTPDAEARWFFRRVFGRAKPSLVFLPLPLTEAIMDSARAGMGIAIMSEWMAGPYLEGGDLVLKRLRGRPLRRPWRMAFRREVMDSAKRLAAALERAAPRVYPSPS